jgi:hypothetical protein
MQPHGEELFLTGNISDSYSHVAIKFSHNTKNVEPAFNDEKRLPWLQEKIPPISSAG